MQIFELDVNSLIQGMVKEVLKNIFVSEPKEIKRIANSNIICVLNYVACHPIYKWKIKIDNKFPLYRNGTILWDKYKIEYIIEDNILNLKYTRIRD